VETYAKAVFQAEMAPVSVPDPKGKRKKHNLVTSIMEKTARLPFVCIQDDMGVIMAANALVFAMVLLLVPSLSHHHKPYMNTTFCPWHTLYHMAWMDVDGCEPKIVGIGPIPAIHKVTHFIVLSLASFYTATRTHTGNNLRFAMVGTIDSYLLHWKMEAMGVSERTVRYPAC